MIEIEDELLKRRFKHGSRSAVGRIYEKYADYLLTVAIALLNDTGSAEDVLHDVFVSFVKSAEKFRLRGSLKAYLATAVVNRCRDRIRANQRKPGCFDDIESASCSTDGPGQSVICDEESRLVSAAIAKLPFEQREAVVLHITAGLKFRQIAKLQAVSVNTIQGRYRYGLRKLRSILDGEVEK